MLKAVILGFACFILFLVLHIIVFRFFTLKERFRAMTLIFYSIIPIYIALYWLIPTGYMILTPVGDRAFVPFLSMDAIYKITAALYFLSGLMLYAFLFLGYCQFYFIVDRSISVRLMIELERAPLKRLSYEEMQKVYPFSGMLSRRLEHMVEGSYLKVEAGYYSNTGKGRLEARVFRFLKDFLRLGIGG
ncbi:MAG: hypothetical protein HYS21_06185 [Deltaproteobacteria bacterium]|nr:hypothetical protein [Deltaproteobacteria bacterium]